MSKADIYLNTLLAGLDGTGQADNSLLSIVARAWNRESAAKFQPGKLTISEAGILPDSPGEISGSWTDEQGFVARIYRHHPQAGRYTYYHLARSWAARQSISEKSEVSVFDHNRLAAIAAVSKGSEHATQTGATYLYLKGDITGIQSFLYQNIQAEQIGEAERVGKRLRGRSFLVAILGDLIADYLVDKLGLEQANILFVGGGHFNLLLPDRPGLRREIEDLIWNVNRNLIDEFGLQLGLLVAFTSVTAKDFTNFGSIFVKTNDELERAKQRRYSQHLTEVFYEKVKKPGNIAEKPAEEGTLEELGRQIPRAAFVLEIRDAKRIPSQYRRHIIPVASLGLHLLLIEAQYNSETAEIDENATWLSALETVQTLSSEAGFLKLHRLNHTDFLPPADLADQFVKLPLAYGFWLVGQYAPVYTEYLSEDKARGGIMELSDLASLNEEGKPELGYAQLAAMRLDVDDLGALFASGLENQSDLTHTLALSREMQLFFGGYFNRLAAQHHIYVVYSGGDDAFVLGSWYNMLHFARTLRRDFKRFTANNPELGFSAGIYLCNPAYPIARLAKDAEEQEKIAKKRGTEGKKGEEQYEGPKDAIRVFGHTLSWDRFEEMMEVGRALFQQTVNRESGLRRSILQHLLSVIQSAHKAKLVVEGQKSLTNANSAVAEAEAHFEFYRNIGRLHGLLSRRGYVGQDMIEAMLSEMKDFNLFQDYLLPLQYVLYKTRNNERRTLSDG